MTLFFADFFCLVTHLDGGLIPDTGLQNYHGMLHVTGNFWLKFKSKPKQSEGGGILLFVGPEFDLSVFHVESQRQSLSFAFVSRFDGEATPSGEHGSNFSQ